VLVKFPFDRKDLVLLIICETHGTIDLLFSMATTECKLIARSRQTFDMLYVLLKTKCLQFVSTCPITGSFAGYHYFLDLRFFLSFLELAGGKKMSQPKPVGHLLVGFWGL